MYIANIIIIIFIITFYAVYLNFLHSQVACTFIAAILHYFFLSVFCWMLCEGVMLYLMLVVVFSTLSKKWWFFLILGWSKCLLTLYSNLFLFQFLASDISTCTIHLISSYNTLLKIKF